ncbi:MAG: ComF family protein [Clostridiales bacterium]|nr:ComF family protein [Clostridiales bacterium]
MGILKEAADMIFPANCIICGGSTDNRIRGHVVCKRCLSGMVPLERERRFSPCLQEPYSGDPVPGLILYMPYPYDPVFRTSVNRMKFYSCPEIGGLLGTLLGTMLKSEGASADAVVHVPLSVKRLKERGYDQAAIIAKEVADILQIPLFEGAVVRKTDTLRQTESENRALNISGAFEVPENMVLEGLKLILVDDVATTGNTLHEVASALVESGASEVLCAAVCGNRAGRNTELY